MLLRVNIFILIFIVSAERLTAGDMDKLISDLESRDLRTRLSAVEEMGRIKDGMSIDLLMDVAGTKGEDWEIKVRAIQFLGEIGNPKAARLLIRILNDPFLNDECPAIKWYTAIALGNFKEDSRVVDALITALKDNNLIVREAAIQSIGEISDSRAIPFLLLKLNDKSFAIKFSTIKALKNIGDPQSIPFLKQIAENDTDSYIRSEALSTLENFAIKGN